MVVWSSSIAAVSSKAFAMMSFASPFLCFLAPCILVVIVLLFYPAGDNSNVLTSKEIGWHVVLRNNITADKILYCVSISFGKNLIFFKKEVKV